MNDLLTHTITRRKNVRQFVKSKYEYFQEKKIRPVLHNGFCRLTLSPKKSPGFYVSAV